MTVLVVPGVKITRFERLNPPLVGGGAQAFSALEQGRYSQVVERGTRIEQAGKR